MPGLLPNVDPDGLLEFSVVYTDRSLNHMSEEFKRVMVDISSVLKDAYNASSAVIVPGSGTFGMEAVARQFANNQKCLVLRNGWFSYRWTQIFDLANITNDIAVLKGRQLEDSAQGVFAPAPIEEVVAYIKKEKPAVEELKLPEVTEAPTKTKRKPAAKKTSAKKKAEPKLKVKGKSP